MSRIHSVSIILAAAWICSSSAFLRSTPRKLHSVDVSYILTSSNHNVNRADATRSEFLSHSTDPSIWSNTCLHAKKRGRIKAATPVVSTGKRPMSGFGGATTMVCPCGSNLPYNKCCGKLHTDQAVFAAAHPAQVVRARYTAYAKRVIDFIIASTHPLNAGFIQDIQHWKTMIEQDCFDNFELTKCEILEESVQENDRIATVRFKAHMIQRDNKERIAFIETSTFERDETTGAWLYKQGVVEPIKKEPVREDSG